MATWSHAAQLPRWREHYIERLVEDLCVDGPKEVN
jgi:hypothetical protein